MSLSHRPRKRFSQNFLTDEALIAQLVETIAPRPMDIMVEIGPGLGALTRPLASIVKPLHVVEIDRDIAARLRNEFAPEDLVIHEGDALQFDFARLDRLLRVVGNLPYHISTPLLFHFAEYAAALRDVHVMLQQEVVERMIAQAGASNYGRLSVMLQYRFEIERVLDVPAAAFRPMPKVDSAVARMIPRDMTSRHARDEDLLESTVAAAFSQRRKTLRNTLGQFLSVADFSALQIDPQARAQTLTVEDFVRIADYRAEKRVQT